MAVSIGWHDDVTTARDAIAQAIERVQGAEGVLILTDMFGGTPSNLGLTFLETNRVEVITGVNLPMLIKLAGLQTSSDLLKVAREMCDNGRNAIWVASDLLHARGEDVDCRGFANRDRDQSPRASRESGGQVRASRVALSVAGAGDARLADDGREKHHGHIAAGRGCRHAADGVR